MRLDLTTFLPELVLVGTIIFLFLIDFFVGDKKKFLFPLIASFGLLGMMAATQATSQLPPAHFFSEMVTADPMGRFFKYLFGAGALLTIFFSQKSPEVEKTDQPSYYTLLVALVLGMNLLTMSSHFLTIYLSLEFVSVLSYILTGYIRASRRSSEAALKYVIYGGVASGIMVYGLSLLYGLTGTMDLSLVSEFLKTHAVNRQLLFFAILLTMAGFAYKIAVFPFHMWSPDVYEGAPTPFTAFLSVGPKAAGFAVLIRFCLTALATPDGSGFVDIKFAGWPGMIALLSAATMTIGNFSAIGQSNMKRLLAYSSIAHAGYLLMGFAALNEEAIRAVLFYLAVYTIMNLGAFFVVIVVARELHTEHLDGYRGLGRRGGLGTLLALSMTVFLFSLTGIPPFAGFIGKFYLFGAVMRSGLYWLAIVGVLNSVVSLYYYVRVIKVMFFEEAPDSRSIPLPALQHSTVVGALAVATIYLGLFWNSLARWSLHSSHLFFKG